MDRLREAVAEFAFTAVLALIGVGVVFGVSALFHLPWLTGVLNGALLPVIGLLVLLGPTIFVVWSVRKIRERRRQPAE